MNKHAVIFVPGLNDNKYLNKLYSRIVRSVWELQGITLNIFYPNWEDGKSLASKLSLLDKVINRLVSEGFRVSLVGQSAGGSFVLNSYTKNKKAINKVINITGRLRAGENVRPTLEKASRHSTTFKDSVLLFEKENNKLLTPKDLQKVVTLTPFFDEIVPKSTVFLKGANNLSIPMIEHGLSGGFAAILWSRKLIKVLD